MPIVAVAVSDRTPFFERATDNVVIRSHEHAPLNQGFPPKRVWAVYRPPLSLGNQPNCATSPANTRFPQSCLLSDGFENGAVFGVQYASW
jgi:hypothetical protein